ncbi:hypothetical protein [Photorhabdus cinerea]|uniref:LamG domain-containing protein n=1 Tax=Photorhabdus cinerea TaxID=471575 RepID=A0A7X5QFE8_9GAMM|nr:hypothetical protein [Photorhabdus cinerea]NHB93237.1 hypothetical protein [Photorhabdus cinerea]
MTIKLDDITDFENNKLNSWKPRLPEFTSQGHANWQFITINGKKALLFNTNGGIDNSGSVLTKQYSNLTFGHWYSLTVYVRRYNNVNPAPTISLRVGVSENDSPNDTIIYGATIPEQGNGTILSGLIRAQDPAYYFKIYNSTPDALGNDFSISRIQVTEHVWL